MNELARRETLTVLVGTYKQAMADVEQAYKLLEESKKKLRSVFLNEYFNVIRQHNCYSTDAGEVKAVQEEITRQAWRCIVDRLEIRRILSIKRREELDRQLHGDKRGYEPTPPLPEITEENILVMLQDGMAKATDYANEAIYEVFDWLRPQRGKTAGLKTNEKWRIGKKVITEYCCEAGYSGAFRVNYSHEKEIAALDNVFSMLDGRGPIKSHHGPLYDAICASKDGTGETDFFRFKCCKNRNLHIEFLRPDLVAKINRTAGGNRIGGAK